MSLTDFAELLPDHVGSLRLGPTVVTSWMLILLLAVLCAVSTRRLSVAAPSAWQTALEGALGAMEGAIESVAPGNGRALLPFIGTLWIFVVAANLIGLVPGFAAPTADLSATAALALLVFASVHWYGIRLHGWGYLRHYLAPTPLMLPFHLLSEVSRTIALAMRLFGNMMSLELAVLMLLLVAGFLAPVPLLLLHIVEALVQAYIFGMLALIYIAGALQTRRPNRSE